MLNLLLTSYNICISISTATPNSFEGQIIYTNRDTCLHGQHPCQVSYSTCLDLKTRLRSAVDVGLLKLKLERTKFANFYSFPGKYKNSFRPRLSITLQEENCAIGHVTPRTPLLPICNKQRQSTVTVKLLVSRHNTVVGNSYTIYNKLNPSIRVALEFCIIKIFTVNNEL